MNKDQMNFVARGEQTETQMEEEGRALAAFYRALRRNGTPALLAVQLTLVCARARFKMLFEPACPVRRERE